jgi:hypothetical protein
VRKFEFLASFCCGVVVILRMETRVKKYRQQLSPERSKVWKEKPPKYYKNRKVPVVYYLCRNRQLEHPHFMEVPISSPDGLFLRGKYWKYSIQHFLSDVF